MKQQSQKSAGQDRIEEDEDLDQDAAEGTESGSQEAVDPWANMSDEEVMALSSPEASANGASSEEGEEDGDGDEDAAAEDVADGADGGEAAATEAKAEAKQSEKPATSHTTSKQSTKTQEKPGAAEAEAKKDGAAEDQAASGTKTNAEEAVDWKARYESIMKPFKANGKDFTPTSPEEVIRLMQMGANYTAKMQALKPNLRVMRMLENHQLLDEQKLAFLIDLDRKKPEAIQKLLHDAKIDPIDLDVSKPPAYTPGSYQVSEQEMNLREAVENVAMTPTGRETINLIQTQWDATSKQAVAQDPRILSIIDEQRSNGIYAKIAGEIERRRMLGDLTTTPFIQAYKLVGDELHQAGLLAPAPGTQANPGTGSQPVQDSGKGQPAAQAQRQPLGTRPGQPRKQMSNGDKAKAISPAPRVTSTTKQGQFNPFAMSDDEIMAIPSPPV